MYEFSAPMPYNIIDIEKLLDINNQVAKSKITSLYASLPSNCEFFSGFEQNRTFILNKPEFDYWKNLIEYTLNKNCDFIYLLNLPRAYDFSTPVLFEQFEKLDKLLINLKKIGVKKLRVGSIQLIQYLEENYPYFDILTSTVLEYKTILEYINFIESHQKIKQIIPSVEINKNFNLLKCLRNKYPKIEIELMVNEGCLQGCPNRRWHEQIIFSKNTNKKNDIIFSNEYGTLFCKNIRNKYPVQSLVIGTHIFPWDIKEYSKIGIKKFKFVGRDAYIGNFKLYINSFLMYLKGIDNIKNIENYVLSNFFHHLNGNSVLNNILVKDCLKYLPKINYFKKYGHLCASHCGSDCQYCYKCSEKIQKLFFLIIRKNKQIADFCNPAVLSRGTV